MTIHSISILRSVDMTCVECRCCKGIELQEGTCGSKRMRLTLFTGVAELLGPQAFVGKPIAPLKGVGLCI